MKKYFCFSVVMLVVILMAGCSKDDDGIPAQLTAHKWICYGFGHVEDGSLIPMLTVGQSPCEQKMDLNVKKGELLSLNR